METNKRTGFARLVEIIEDPNHNKLSWHRIIGGIIVFVVLFGSMFGVSFAKTVLDFFQGAVFVAITGMTVSKAADSIGKGIAAKATAIVTPVAPTGNKKDDGTKTDTSNSGGVQDV